MTNLTFTPLDLVPSINNITNYNLFAGLFDLFRCIVTRKNPVHITFTIVANCAVALFTQPHFWSFNTFILGFFTFWIVSPFDYIHYNIIFSIEVKYIANFIRGIMPDCPKLRYTFLIWPGNSTTRRHTFVVIKIATSSINLTHEHVMPIRIVIPWHFQFSTTSYFLLKLIDMINSGHSFLYPNIFFLLKNKNCSQINR